MIGISFIFPQYLWLLLLVPLTIGLALLGRRFASRWRQWGGLVLRAFLLLVIILALAGIQLRLPTNTLTAVFVLDASDSVTPEEQARGEELIRQAVDAMPSGDKAAVVVFGEDALVERLAAPESTLSRITSVPVTTRTDIASALQLAMALFPDDGAKRLVLLSDGRENLGFALKQAELASIQQVELQYISLGETQEQTEVLVDALEAPAEIREGQGFDLGITVQSNAAVGATMRVYADGALIQTQELTLRSGSNRYSVPIQDAAPGFHRFRVQITPDADNRLQNNEATAFTVVSGPPNILLVEGQPGEGDNLAAALEAAKMKVTRIAPGSIPATLPELAQYDTVILANVPAAALPAETMKALPLYVHDLGKGLLMTGGENSFGAGGYLRTPLEEAMPVYMDVKSRELAANLALIVAVDKSGSMGRCHCDNPDLNQTYTASESGQPKVDIAKEAIMRAEGALSREDFLGVVAFDESARWVLPVTQLPDQSALENAIGSFSANGQTNMKSGVTAAYEALKGVNAKRKHVILMTDGWVRTGELNTLARQMKDEGITLSIVAAGEGSAEYLKQLAVDGGGRFYPATDMMSVPDIFLKETVKSVGQYIIEQPSFALPDPSGLSPALRGIDTTDLPMLSGYNGTSPKTNIRTDLMTDKGDPLLATWQYGLGRAAAWTSDLKGQWAADWVQWRDFSKFASQLVGGLLPVPQVEGLDARVSLQDEGAVVTLDARDEAGRPRNGLSATARWIDPDLGTVETPLEQVGPGQYQAVTRADQPGTYLVWLGVNDNQQGLGQMTMGMVVPYSPEYRAGGINRGLLDELARITGGGPLADPVQAFLHNLPSVGTAREIWRALLLLAALLFPIDVALRRLILTRRDWAMARAWVVERLPGKQLVRRPGEPQVLGSLFTARERARRQTQVRPAQPHAGVTEVKPPQETPPTEPPPQPKSPAQEDSLARLREAKKRAKR